MPEYPTSRRRTALWMAVAMALWAGGSNAATVDFEELPAVDPGAGVIPTASLLDTQYLASHGVRFRTRARSAVAVVRQANSATAGDRNGISGVYDGEPRSLAPVRQLVISFWVPTNTGLAAVTDQVRLRLDPRELTTVVPYFTPHGVDGGWIHATVTPGEDPGTLEIRAPGIHSVEYWPKDENPTAPIREVSFGPLVSSLDSRRLGPMFFEPLVSVLRERYAELSRLQRPRAQWPMLLERIRIRRALVALQNPGRTLASQCRALARAQAEMAGYMDNARFDQMFNETTRSLWGQVRFRLRRLDVPVPLYQLLPDDSRIDSARRRFQVAYESLERGQELCIPAPQEHPSRVFAAQRQAGALAFARAAANVPTLEASEAFIPKLLSTGTLRQIGRLDGRLLVSTTGFNLEGGLTNGTLHFDSVHTTILRPPRSPPPFPFPYPPLPPALFQQRVRMTVSGIACPGTYYPKAAAVANDNVLCFSTGEGPDPPPCCGGTPPESVDTSAEEGYARLDITHLTPEFVAGYYFFSTSCYEFGFATGIFKLSNQPGP